ncbi:MAG: TetR/AcrR family transcriptional regulator [Chloroflexi bacterium]|nr:MAG: TetR/AcrR family transcriptional regulator [Chloroflexota bacterium]TMF37955.1 MAG: TetR/AcrR family transcriptional regulator [Chloroflexota bacterium]
MAIVLPKTRKGENSRAAILNAALDLFRERGYEATTMRAIADLAGVSLGGSYHYFPSKEHLVLEFYRHTHELHLVAIAPLLAREKDLGSRLRGTVRAVVITCEPFHAVAGSIFSTVANPSSPLNPFGGAARPLREEVVALYAEVVKGSDARIPADIAEMLPLTLWLYQMAILYFWIFDRSPGRLRTLEVIDETTELIVRLLGLANLPVLRSSRKRILGLVRSVAGGSIA